MHILGIDPGSIIMGYGLISKENQKTYYLDSGCIKVGNKEWSKRLKDIFDNLSKIILQYKPQQVAIERVFVYKNAASALKLGEARGASIVAVACQNLPIFEYSAREVKKTVVGYGNAEKIQIQRMIKSIFKLNIIPAVDAADALAVALCHAHMMRKELS